MWFGEAVLLRITGKGLIRVLFWGVSLVLLVCITRPVLST